MENKLNLPLKKKKNEAESPRLDPLMRALKALHSAGAPETMTEEELEHQRRSQEVLGRLTAPMAGMDYEEFSLGGTRLLTAAVTQFSTATAAATRAATSATRACSRPSSRTSRATTC